MLSLATSKIYATWLLLPVTHPLKCLSFNLKEQFTSKVNLHMFPLACSSNQQDWTTDSKTDTSPYHLINGSMPFLEYNAT